MDLVQSGSWVSCIDTTPGAAMPCRAKRGVARLYGAQRPPTSSSDLLALMERRAHRFEVHPVVREFVAIVESGRMAPAVPGVLHRLLARAAVSLLPPLVRERLGLGRELDLGRADRIALKVAGGVADRFALDGARQCRACARLGLPSDFLYRDADAQQPLLAETGPGAGERTARGTSADSPAVAQLFTSTPETRIAPVAG